MIKQELDHSDGHIGKQSSLVYNRTMRKTSMVASFDECLEIKTKFQSEVPDDAGSNKCVSGAIVIAGIC